MCIATSFFKISLMDNWLTFQLPELNHYILFPVSETKCFSLITKDNTEQKEIYQNQEGGTELSLWAKVSGYKEKKTQGY